MSLHIKIFTWLCKTCLAGIGKFSPRAMLKGKRILLLSSVNAELVRQGILDKQTLKTLNDQLVLAHKNNSLEIGTQLAPGIWKGFNFKQALPPNSDDYVTLTQAQRFCDEVVNHTPDWLKYDLSTMQHDIVDLVIEHRIVN